jgi:hypothetical protein
MHPDLSALCTHICLACKQLSLYNVRHMSCMLARLPNAFYNAHVQYTLLTTVVLTNVGADFAIPENTISPYILQNWKMQ